MLPVERGLYASEESKRYPLNSDFDDDDDDDDDVKRRKR